jgi:hypothetical protein
MGTKCVDKQSRGSNLFGVQVTPNAAMTACHNDGMELCPLSTIQFCDHKNYDRVSGSKTDFSCGTLTDRSVADSSDPNLFGFTNAILTATPGTNDEGLAVSCFYGNYDLNGAAGGGAVSNWRTSCTAGYHYFCCAPVNP